MSSRHTPVNLFGENGMRASLPINLINVAYGSLSCQMLYPIDQINLRDTQEIPNSQEIFVYRDCGASIIIDILQKADIEDPEAAAKWVSVHVVQEALMQDITDSTWMQ
jgi:hypothetical protein